MMSGKNERTDVTAKKRKKRQKSGTSYKHMAIKAAATTTKKIATALPGVGLIVDAAAGATETYLKCQPINNAIYKLRAMLAETLYEHDYDKIINHADSYPNFKAKRDDSIFLLRCVLGLYAVKYSQARALIKTKDQVSKEFEDEFLRLKSVIKKLRGILTSWWRVQWNSTNLKKLQQVDALVHEDMLAWKHDIDTSFLEIVEATSDSLSQIGKGIASEINDYVLDHPPESREGKMQYLEDVIEEIIKELQKDKACKAMRNATGVSKKKQVKLLKY